MEKTCYSLINSRGCLAHFPVGLSGEGKISELPFSTVATGPLQTMLHPGAGGLDSLHNGLTDLSYSSFLDV